jgi:predicted molibdopterin-dependent oxidoreductase YjgC
MMTNDDRKSDPEAPEQPEEIIQSIDNYGSEGFEINLHHKAGNFTGASARRGLLNTHGLISPKAARGFESLNDRSRLVRPLLRRHGELEEISWEEALRIITERISAVDPDENAFYAGARLGCEEIYMVQKLARAGARTNNVNCFHYMGRGIGYGHNASHCAPLSAIDTASRIFILGNTLHKDHPLIDQLIAERRSKKNLSVQLLTTAPDFLHSKIADHVITITSYYWFLRAANYFLLSGNMLNEEKLRQEIENYDEYKVAVMAYDFDELFAKSGICCIDQLAAFAKSFCSQPEALLICSEKELSSNSCLEISNLTMLATAGTADDSLQPRRYLALKEKNNAQGVIEMGGCHKVAPGFQPYDAPGVVEKLEQIWKVKNMPRNILSPYKLLDKGLLKNIFIFGEDPVGCAIDKPRVDHWLDKVEFLAVQDYFVTDTAARADLVLPASLPFEIGGTYINTHRVRQTIEVQQASVPIKNSLQQLAALLHKLGVDANDNHHQIMEEANQLMPDPQQQMLPNLQFTRHDNMNRMFDFGCDILHKRIEEASY